VVSGKVGKEAEEVLLQTNSLTRLPATIGLRGWWTGVRFLCASSNAITALPPEVGRLAQLQELNLNDNHLESLPSELFSGCTQLSILYLNNNRLRTLPATIGHCQSLKVGTTRRTQILPISNQRNVVWLRGDVTCEWQ
jgi:leucine-rich repeat protein SHOC2